MFDGIKCSFTCFIFKFYKYTRKERTWHYFKARYFTSIAFCDFILYSPWLGRKRNVHLFKWERNESCYSPEAYISIISLEKIVCCAEGARAYSTRTRHWCSKPRVHAGVVLLQMSIKMPRFSISRSIRLLSWKSARQPDFQYLTAAAHLHPWCETPAEITWICNRIWKKNNIVNHASYSVPRWEDWHLKLERMYPKP